jgi:hypothetical protein
MTTLEAWEKERERHTHGVEDTADLIVRLNAKAIVDAYRAGKEAGDAERDRLREHNNTLKLALSEALDEIEAMTDESAMGAGRIAQHRLWMAGMRAALEGKETSDE